MEVPLYGSDFYFRCPFIQMSLTLLHSKRPKLYEVLAILSAEGLKGNATL